MVEAITQLNIPKLAFAVEQKPDLQVTQTGEMEMWKKWKEGGMQPDDLRPLLHSFKPLIKKHAHQWMATTDLDLSPAAIHMEFKKHFVNALASYDPDRGAKLGTWISSSLRGAQRWVANNRHPARMGETRFYRVGKFNNAKSVLYDQLGREPTTQEMSEHLNWSPAEVARSQAEQRKALPQSGWQYDPATVSPSREAEALRIAMHEFNPQEQLVAEHTWGMNGKEELKPLQIAKRLNISPSTVTRLRNSIADKIDQYLK